METVSAVVGLAIPVFQCAKALRDRVKLVRYLPHPLRTLRALTHYHVLRSHQRTPNSRQHSSNTKRTLTSSSRSITTIRHSSISITSTPTYGSSQGPCSPITRSRLDLTIRRIIRDLDDWLNSINPNLGKQNVPSLKELWKSRHLREKMVRSNAKIGSIRNRWQVQGVLWPWGRTELTTITARCDCKFAHSRRRRRSLADWTLVRRKQQPCSSR